MSRHGSTLHEVAEYAGVSIATVSRVVRNVDRVSDTTRARVLEAIEHLNYRPSHFGRALVTKRHDTLGFIVPGLVGPYFAEVVHGCTEVCIEVRKSVLVFSTHLLPELDEQILGMTDRVDGLIIAGGTLQPEMLQRLRDTGIPLVLLSQHPVFDIPTVRVDNITETRAIVRHLIEEHDCREFAFVGSFHGSPDAEDRWSATIDTIAEAGLQPPTEPIDAGFHLEAGTEVAHHLRSLPVLPDALICGNDEIAIGTMSALKLHGIRVPEDIAVTGWDDITIAAHTNPSLTTVRQFTRSLGRKAGETLLSLVKGEAVPADQVLSSELVVRDSCGCTAMYLPPYSSIEPARNVV